MRRSAASRRRRRPRTRKSRWSQKELEGVRDLYNKHLIQISRLTTLERDAARLNGERAQYIASRAQAKGKITETELQIIQVDKDVVSEVSKDLRETNDKIGEFVERKVTRRGPVAAGRHPRAAGRHRRADDASTPSAASSPPATPSC